jgi:hypothetical protein
MKMFTVEPCGGGGSRCAAPAFVLPASRGETKVQKAACFPVRDLLTQEETGDFTPRDATGIQ